MAANFGLVVHAAQRDADKLPPKRSRDRLSQRGLSHAWRPNKAQNRTLHRRLQPPHGEKIQNAVFDLFQIVVIRIQNFFRFGDVHFAAGSFRPRQHRQPLDVVPGNRIVRRHGGHARQSAQFFQRFFLDLVRHAGIFDFLPQFFGIARAFILLAQFLLNGLHLLAQVVLPLRLLHSVLHLRLDLVAELLHLQLFRQMLVNLLQAHSNIGRLERVLLIGGGERRQRRGNEIDQAARLLDVHRHGGKLIRECRRPRNNLLKQGQHVTLQGFYLRPFRRNSFGNRIHPPAHKGGELCELHQPNPLQPLGKNEQALVRHLDHFVNHRQRPHRIEVRGLGRIHTRFPLRYHHDGLVLAQGVNQLDRALSPP